MKIEGLYAITPDERDTNRLLAQVRATLAGGASMLQYRSFAEARVQRRQANALVALCALYGARFIINNDVELAAAVNADGVHLGKHDLSIEKARLALGPTKIIGASCYDDLQRAETAAADGADYVAFGSFFASPTKLVAVRAELDLLRCARRLGLPQVAIGGINLNNARAVIAAGADAIAVISALFTAADIEIAAHNFCKLFNSKTYDFA